VVVETFHLLNEDGSCDANSIPCWIKGEDSRADSATSQSAFGNTSSSTAKNTVYNDKPETRKGRQLACCTGLTMDLLIELMKDLNFEVELYEVKDRLWGGWTKDGWNGLVRELMDRKADMAITSLKITPNRSEQIDFSVPFLDTGIAITVASREGAISPTAF
uniref:Lig_chan-Glu_bd domain-containing protein n=1 Tax=Mesocestoides corti TaxID=53468 RepID=A0A5K3FZK0_MESCO